MQGLKLILLDGSILNPSRRRSFRISSYLEPRIVVTSAGEVYKKFTGVRNAEVLYERAHNIRHVKEEELTDETPGSQNR